MGDAQSAQNAQRDLLGPGGLQGLANLPPGAFPDGFPSVPGAYGFPPAGLPNPGSLPGAGGLGGVAGLPGAPGGTFGNVAKANAAPSAPVASAAGSQAQWPQGGGAGGGAGGGGGVERQASTPAPRLDEASLLAQLVQLLGNRARQSLLLSDLGALLPGALRQGVKEQGGLRSMLQRYPDLFSVSGQPGKESVTLMVGAFGTGQKSQSSNLPHAKALVPGKLEVGHGAADYGTSTDWEKRREEEDLENQAAVQLRGLPYRATVADVKHFLGKHVHNLKDDNSVQLVLNRDGRPSGFARVQFVSAQAARMFREEKHMEKIETLNAPQQSAQTQERYVEIFLFSERPNKLRFKKATSAELAAEEEDPEASSTTKESVIEECREHMRSPGKGQLLLSMLGVALSQGARTYLKKTDQGLKHFLSQYPMEFKVDGVKGRECITYLPAASKNGENSDIPMGAAPSTESSKGRRARGIDGTGGPTTGNLSELHKSKGEEELRVPESPVSAFAASPNLRGMCTPSDWGTPVPQAELWGNRRAPSFSATGPSAVAATAAALGPTALELLRNSGDPASLAAAAAMFGPGQTGDAATASAAAAAGYSNPNWANWPPFMWGPPPWGPGGFPPLGAPPPNPFGPPPFASSPNSQDGATAAQENSPAWAFEGTEPESELPPAADAAAGPAVRSKATEQALASEHVADTTTPASPGVGAQSRLLRLRGLPFSSTEQDVLAFFAKHDIVEMIADEASVCKLMTKANGKPSGQAIVKMRSPEDVTQACKILDGQWIGTRYIEVFHHLEDESGNVLPTPERDEANDEPARGGEPQNVNAAVDSSLSGSTGFLGASMLSSELLAPPQGGSPVDRVGDTGGSGGAFGMHAAMLAALPLWENRIGAMSGSGGLEGTSPVGEVGFSAPAFPSLAGAPGFGAHSAAPPPVLPPPPQIEQSDPSWKALFEFLETSHHKDTPPPLPGQGPALDSQTLPPMREANTV